MTDTRTDPRASVLVIQPDEAAGADLFEPWFHEAGLAVRLVRPYAGDPVPTAVDASALVVLGGEMSATDDDEFPWLADIRDLLKSAVAEQVPTLGICLGGQLMTVALGGTVTKGTAGPEIGVVDLDLTPAAADDRLFGKLADPVAVISYHGDAMTALPAGAVLLAGSSMYSHQAFRIEPTAWAVQFHPEVSIAGFERWMENAPERHADPTLPAREAGDVRQRWSEIAPTVRRIADQFIEVLAG